MFRCQVSVIRFKLQGLSFWNIEYRTAEVIVTLDILNSLFDIRQFHILRFCGSKEVGPATVPASKGSHGRLPYFPSFICFLTPET